MTRDRHPSKEGWCHVTVEYRVSWHFAAACKFLCSICLHTITKHPFRSVVTAVTGHFFESVTGPSPAPVTPPSGHYLLPLAQWKGGLSLVVGSGFESPYWVR